MKLYERTRAGLLTVVRVKGGYLLRYEDEAGIAYIGCEGRLVESKAEARPPFPTATGAKWFAQEL